MKDTAVYQEVPVPKRDIFDRKHPMFVGFHPDLKKKLEGCMYQHSVQLVAMEIEKYQWNVMVSGEPDDLYESSLSMNMLSLLETQTMELDFQLELQTTIWDITTKLKTKATLHSLGGQFKAFVTQWKVMKKTEKQVLEILLKKTG